MLEQMMRAVARKIIAQEYPHAKSPAVVYATVSKASARRSISRILSFITTRPGAASRAT